MIDQLDMFGAPMPKVVPPQSKGEQKLLDTPLFPEAKGAEKKEVKKEKKEKAEKLPAEQVIDLTTKPLLVSEKAVTVQPNTPLPSEVFAGEVFEQWKPQVGAVQKGDAGEDYYKEQYMQWAAPTAAEQDLPYHQKGDAYYQKMAQVYVWPTLWRLFSNHIKRV